MNKNRKQKKASLHVTLLLIVSGLMILMYPSIAADWQLASQTSHELLLKGLLVLNTLFLCYFWLNGFKDVVYVLFYFFIKRTANNIEKNCLAAPLRKTGESAPKVLLLYCTCNDFMGFCLAQSMQQAYQNYQVVILDDSTEATYQEEIDEFAACYGALVIRRTDHQGYKAGNLNHYLKEKVDYDYFIILDSDEIIPPNFIVDALKMFQGYGDVGIVQARHIATRNENYFMQFFSRSVKANWPTYLQTKQFYGFQFFFGHGAMISKECYQAVGGFPSLVAEDLCFSLKARLAGYFTIYANSIECEEQFPVDYYAFKKRHSKWTQGNLEFLKKYAKFILTSPLKWYEKFDLVLFTFNLPLMAVFTIYLLMNIIAFPLLRFSPHYEAWVLLPTLLVFLAPTLNDIVYFTRPRHLLQFLIYWLGSLLLYGSLFFLSLTTYLKALGGVKAKFLVTPKTSSELTLLDALWLSKGELFYGLLLALVSLIFTKSLASVVLIIIPAFASPLLFLWHKRDNKKVLVCQMPLDYPQEAQMQTVIENTPLSLDKLLADTKVLVVLSGEKILNFFKIIGYQEQGDGFVYLQVEETQLRYKRIRYPLVTTEISYTDISEFY